MVSQTLSKSATMKFQKVREYLEHRSLEELQGLQTKFSHQNNGNDRNIIKIKSQNNEYEDKVVKKSLVANNTQDTEFNDDQMFASTMEMASPKLYNQETTKPKLECVIDYKDKIVERSVDHAIYSAKAQVRYLKKYKIALAPAND
jgi:hypothetical protein